jgi:hypothetical protein
MASGASAGGDITTPIWVALDTSTYVPSTAGIIKTMMRDSSNVLLAAPNNNYGGYTSTTNPTFAWVSGGGNIPVNMLLESTNVYWASNGNAVFACNGWEDSL